VPDETHRYLWRKDAAAFLTERGYKTATATLAKLACVGGGLQFRYFGNKPIYDPLALLAWAESKLSTARSSTSERSAGIGTPGKLDDGRDNFQNPVIETRERARSRSAIASSDGARAT